MDPYPAMNIVLLEPEMPANTGNIGRTCVATGSRLHLIGPLGFQVNEKAVKRAGLDYWDKLDVTIYDCYRDFLEKNPRAAESLHGGFLRAGGLHHVRKGERRNPGGASGEAQGDDGPHPHAAGHPFPEPGQFRGHRTLRGSPAEPVCPHAGGRKTQEFFLGAGVGVT